MPQPHSCCRELEKLKKGVRRELCDTNSLEQLELFGEIEQYQYKLSGERVPDLGKMLYLMTLTFPFKSKFSEQKSKSSKNRGAYFAKQQYENKKHTLYRRIEFSSPIFKMILAQAHMSLQKKDCLRKVYMPTSTYLTRLPNAGEAGSIPGQGRSPREGNGNPLQSSCLGNPMDRGTWWATVCGTAKSWT